MYVGRGGPKKKPAAERGAPEGEIMGSPSFRDSRSAGTRIGVFFFLRPVFVDPLCLGYLPMLWVLSFHTW